jgi:hypothetical protein
MSGEPKKSQPVFRLAALALIVFLAVLIGELVIWSRFAGTPEPDVDREHQPLIVPSQDKPSGRVGTAPYCQPASPGELTGKP